jgi:hypothetical protein
LQRFHNYKAIKKELLVEIDQFFTHYFARDRLAFFQRDNMYLNALPRSLKKAIMVNYLFEDVFYHFMFFFNYNENKDTKFLYDISFGLKPRLFNKDADFCTIYDEEDEVMEMYLI